MHCQEWRNIDSSCGHSNSDRPSSGKAGLSIEPVIVTTAFSFGAPYVDDRDWGMIARDALKYASEARESQV